MRIFLSYASEDREIAERICLALTGAGHRVFFDRNSLPAGGDFVQRIRAGLLRSDALVFLISPDSIEKSSFALNELLLAQDRWKHPKNRVVPVMVRQTPIADVPAYLKAVTILDPIGDLPAHLLYSISKLRPRDKTIKATAVLGACALAAGLLSWVLPARSFQDVKAIPPREDAVQVARIVDRSQLVEDGHGKLFQSPSRGIDNGYFRLVIPAFSESVVGENTKLQGGVSLVPSFSPNLYFQVQLLPVRNVNTIDLYGCGLAVVFKIRSRALFFYSTEADASPHNIPLDIDYSRMNSLGFRQVGSDVAAFLNDQVVGTFKAKTRPGPCSPKLHLKANPGSEAEAEFQGLSIYEFARLNIWSRRAVF